MTQTMGSYFSTPNKTITPVQPMMIQEAAKIIAPNDEVNITKCQIIANGQSTP
jgi:hypothetical protein